MDILQVCTAKTDQIRTFPKGDGWTIDEGYLLIFEEVNDEKIYIAAFAPGEWAYVFTG